MFIHLFSSESAIFESFLSAPSIIVKLRSRSGEGQVRIRKVRFGREPYNKFGFHPPPAPPTLHTNFFLCFKGV